MFNQFFEIGSAFWAGVLLLSLRLGSVLLITPILGVFGLPTRLKLMIVLTLSFALIYGAPDWTRSLAVDEVSVFFAFTSELMMGLTLSLGILMAFGAVSIAGRLLDTQIGFGIAQIFDPLTKRSHPIVTGGFNQFSVVLFFVLDFHHTLLRGIALSVDSFPLGKSWEFSESAPVLLKYFSGMFALGFSMVAPVVMCILVVEFALAVLTRNLPQLHMFTLGIPIKILVGVFALVIWLAGAESVMRRIYNNIFDSWKVLFAHV